MIGRKLLSSALAMLAVSQISVAAPLRSAPVPMPIEVIGGIADETQPPSGFAEQHRLTRSGLKTGSAPVAVTFNPGGGAKRAHEEVRA